jgi:hypothetical protein
MGTLGEVNGMSELQRQDMLAFINYLRVAAGSVQDELGWGKPPKPAPKKRK